MQKVKVEFRDLGRIPYKEAWDYQMELHERLKTIKKSNRDALPGTPPIPQEQYMLFCEHPHVYTLGKSGSKDNLLLDDKQMKDRHIEFFPVNRGGDITYHGPGQIVGYPVLDLSHFFEDIHRFVRTIEEVMIRTIAEYGLEGYRIEGYSGVWLPETATRPKRKICAVGIHLSRWVTLHGFAFNVNTDLSLFDNIIPCGIVDKDKSVTSLAAELGREMDMDEVKSKVKYHIADLMVMEWG